MRSRTLREGSLGLFVILGLGLLGVLVLWLRGVSLGRRTFEVVVEFEDAIGIQPGATVRYRGVSVGRLLEVVPGANGVDAKVEILSPDLKIPRPQKVEVNQGGLIGDTTIDIVPPPEPLANPADLEPPVSRRCNSEIVVCAGDRLDGEVGVNFAELTRASTRFTDAFSEPEFVATVTQLLENTSRATEELAQLASDMSTLTVLAQEELGLLTDSTLATSQALSRTAQQFGNTADSLNRLTDTTNALLLENRTRLVRTLDNFDALSGELRQAARGITPVLQRSDRTLALLNQNLSDLELEVLTTELETLLENATVLSRNAADASENLRDASAAVNDPANLLLLQQTLESARSTFQNVEKITSDLDDLTGDPEFRENLRRMVDGLSGLVSLSEQLERETELAQTLSPLEEKRLEALRQRKARTPDAPNAR